MHHNNNSRLIDFTEEPTRPDFNNYIWFRDFCTFGKFEITSQQFLDFLFQQVYPEKNKINRESRQYIHIKRLSEILLNQKLSIYDYVGINRRDDMYSSPKDVNKNYLLSYSILLRIIDTLKGIGLIEQKLGFHNPVTGRGEITKIRATEVFFTLLNSYENPYSLKPEATREREKILIDKVKKVTEKNESNDNTRKYPKLKNLLMRDDNKKQVECSYNKITSGWNNTLKKYNRLLQNSKIELSNSQADYSELVIYRIFNDKSLKKGGRFYGGWFQNISKKMRSDITINDEETIELDFKSIHPVLAYGMVYIDYFTESNDTDPYYIEELKDYREFCKKVLLLAFNCKNRASVISTLRNFRDRNDRKPDFERISIPSEYSFSEILDFLCKKHDKIKELFFIGIGKELQFQDSNIANAIINHFTSKGIVVLSIHDSFIIQKKHQDELADVMIKFTKELYNVTAIVEKTK